MLYRYKNYILLELESLSQKILLCACQRLYLNTNCNM